MKIDDNILKQFCLDGQDEIIEKKGMTISEILEFLRSTSKRMITKTNTYFKSDDLLEKEDCLDIIGYRFNDFIQAFIDLIKYLKSIDGNPLDKKDGLSKCVWEYKRMRDKLGQDEEVFLNNMTIRNDLAHEYFSYEMNRNKLVNLITNGIEGSSAICDFFDEYCNAHNLLEGIIEHPE